MKGLGNLISTSVALTATTALASTLQPRASSLPTVSVKGNAFFTGNSRFYIRGVDYQPGGSSNGLIDPLADANICSRDIPEFQKLGANAIRVYTVDNSKDHDACMQQLANAGIYLILDVNTPKYSINRAEPAQSYNDVYLQNVFATIDVFQKYTNTLAFFAGNEVINNDTNTEAATYVKAVIRDMRQYIGERGYRTIPVGYSAADVADNRMQMAHYLNCGSDDARSDFFAFNDYSWCDPSSFTTSGWDQKVQNFSDYSIPIFLSEYGCIKGTREWEEVSALYSTQMSSVYSGGLVYEYSEEGNGYGLLTINSDGSLSEKSDFTALEAAFKSASNPSGDGGFKTTNTPSECPATDANWQANTVLPAMPSPASKYLTEGAGTPSGLTGPGSQDAGTGSSGPASAGSGKVTTTAAGAKKTGASSPIARPQEAMGGLWISGVVFLAGILGAAKLF